MSSGDILAGKKALPEMVRIKRKRGQDPLRGLLLNPQTKRSRTDRYVFKLAGTFEQEPAESANMLLQEDVDMKETQGPKRVFHFQKDQNKRQRKLGRTEDPELKDTTADTTQYTKHERAKSGLEKTKPESGEREQEKGKTRQEAASEHDLGVPKSDILDEMVQEYLQQEEAPSNDHEIEDYVYDIYYREAFNPSKWDTSNLGVIVIDSDDEFQLDQEEAEESDFDSEEDDSNAEDFYRNDYPEDEDAYSSLDEDTGGLREGLEYLGIEDDTYGIHDADEYEHQDEGSWSEDDNFENYRDRILNDLEDKISDARRL